LEKAWSAFGTPEGFGGWFSARVEGEWAQGNAVMLLWPSGSKNEIYLEKVEAPYLFSYQWHPGGSYMLADLPRSEVTTVTIKLSETQDGIELLLVETGFENIPDERRLQVLGLNNEGWDEEIENIRKYIEA
jgi:uncharacterized protein YndB with AHSA1/START domain